MEQNILSHEPTLEKYLEMVAYKASSLFRLFLGLPFLTGQHFSQAFLCGEKSGHLFQIYDDYLDRKGDKSFENILHIASPIQIKKLWDNTYNELLDIGSKLTMIRLLWT